MTKEELSKLTYNQKWERITNLLYPKFPTYWEGTQLRLRYPTLDTNGPAANYLGSLDAMQGAVEHLDPEQENRFGLLLQETVLRAENEALGAKEDDGQPKLNTFGYVAILRLSALELADLFLLTVDAPLKGWRGGSASTDGRNSLSALWMLP